MDGPADRARRALELAREVGFDLAGIAPLRPPAAAGRFRAWLAAGRHAGMAWLERGAERICDPRRVLPEGRSLLVVGLGHARPPVELPGGGRVARYAAGRDYHNRIGKLLRKLARRLEDEGLGGRTRAVVDAGPLLERSHAAEAGLGFESRAANLLSPRLGPWVFLAELLVEPELEPTPGPAPGSCGTCTACIEACPTGAILEPGVVDSNLCISYHTIENRGAVPHALRELVGTWAFGCDVCSEVCPWGRKAPDESASWGTHEAVERGSLVEWLRMGADEHPERLRGSALRRARRDGLARNAAIALGNLATSGDGTDEAAAALAQAMEEDASPTVREAAAWGLARGYANDPCVQRRIERARERERDGDAREGMGRTLER